MKRTFVYIGVWAALVAAAMIARFTVLADTTSDTRLRLAIAVMVLTYLVLAVGNIYESRRLALAAGLRGRGALGYLRGWVKTASVELAADGSPR